jgi:hypothetical protein
MVAFCGNGRSLDKVPGKAAFFIRPGFSGLDGLSTDRMDRTGFRFFRDDRITLVSLGIGWCCLGLDGFSEGWLLFSGLDIIS